MFAAKRQAGGPGPAAGPDGPEGRVFVDQDVPLSGTASGAPWVFDPGASTFPLYALVKLQECGRALQGRRRRHPLTARNVRGLLLRLQERDQGPAELYGVTSHYVRQRLQEMAAAGLLRNARRGMRNAVSYAWAQALDPSAMDAYQELRAQLGNELGVAQDLARLAATVQGNPFSKVDFFVMFSILRFRAFDRRMYTLVRDDDDRAFAACLLRRLQNLQGQGLVAKVGRELHVTPFGHEVAHVFDRIVRPTSSQEA